MDFAASLALIVPEIVLSLSRLVLLLAAAGRATRLERDQHSRLRRARRCFFLVAPAVCAGAAGPDTVAFGGSSAPTPSPASPS
jgi:NADH-quinone oxidoreductase subunit N